MGKEYVLNTYRKLRKRCVPNVIYTSPMYRCIQTAKMLKKLLARDGYQVKIKKNKSLNRYFSKRERAHRPKTRDGRVDVGENWDEFRARVRAFAEKQKFHKNIWMVTHYLVIREFSQLYGFEIPSEHMPAMWHVKVVVDSS